MMAFDTTLEGLEQRTGRKISATSSNIILPRFAMRWAELDGEQPPLRTWAISHWLGHGTTLLAGRGGIGKTLLAQTLATALALGRNFLDTVEREQRVLFWACEDDRDELWRRQVAICRYFNVNLSDLEDKLIIEPRSGMDNTLFYAEYGAPRWTHLFGELKSQVEDYKADVTFIDNIGQTFGGKENDRHHVTSFINGLTGLAADKRLHSTVLLAHPGKQEDSEFSGSTAWENSVRMRWHMGTKLPDQEGKDDEAEEDPTVRYIAKRKTNYTIKDYRRLTYADGVFKSAVETTSFSDRYTFGKREEIAEEIVLKALDRFAGSNIRTTAGKTSPDYLPKKIREMKLAQDLSPREVTEALNRLRLSQRIVEAPIGKYGNRGTKIGLVRAGIDAQT